MARTRNSLAALGFAIAWAVTPAFGDELGTLFHTPKERADLERLRRGESIGGPSAFARPDPVVTGYVKRSDGKSTVFIDKQPYPVGNAKLQEKLEPRIVQRYVEPGPIAPPSESKPQTPDYKSREPGAAPARPPTE